MAIIRIQIDKNFTIIPNELINDSNLDWRDVGLLTFLISKVDEWNVNTEHLMTVKKSKRDAIHASLKSIIAAGYMKRRPHRVEGGKMKGWIYDVSNKPIFLDESPNTDKPNTDKPNTDKPNTDKPNTDKPNTENPDSYKELNLNNTEYKQELTDSKIESARKNPKNLGGGNEAKKEMGFKKPTVEQIESYIIENGFSVDAGRFFDYYESNGWLVSKAPMKNWQATVRNWHRRDLEKGGSNATHQQSDKRKLSANEQFQRAKAERDRNGQSMATVIEGEFKYG